MRSKIMLEEVSQIAKSYGFTAHELSSTGFWHSWFLYQEEVPEVPADATALVGYFGYKAVRLHFGPTWLYYCDHKQKAVSLPPGPPETLLQHVDRLFQEKLQSSWQVAIF